MPRNSWNTSSTAGSSSTTRMRAGAAGVAPACDIARVSRPLIGTPASMRARRGGDRNAPAPRFLGDGERAVGDMHQLGRVGAVARARRDAGRNAEPSNARELVL